jgi:RimJ/RimL family protein N-acetyltransferase
MSNIKLRALTYNDLEKTLEWHNQEDISDMYSGHPFPVNKEMEQKWYEKIMTSNYPTTVFGIELIESKKLIGLTLLKDINLINRSAEFAIYIGEKELRGKGLSKIASSLTIKFGFYKLGLNRIYLKVIDNNIVAIGLYTSIGFVKEGILRNSIYKNNQFNSEIIMSILKSEFNGELENT